MNRRYTIRSLLLLAVLVSLLSGPYVMEVSATDYTVLEYQYFSSTPSGWTTYNFAVYGGEAISDPTVADRQLITKGYDLSSYAGARVVLHTRAATMEEYETGDWVIKCYNETGAHIIQIIAGAGPIGYTEYDLSVNSSYSNFKFGITSATATSNEQIASDNWAIYGITPEGAQEELEDWQYRQQINIDEGTGAGINYTIKVPVLYNGTVANYINLYGHSRTDFGDVRFTDNDKVTMLSYWRETYTTGVSASFWVRITDNMTAANVTFYVYYGNPDVTSTQDGEDTFLMYEDWAMQTVDLDTWDVLASAGSVSYSASASNHGYTAKFDGNAGATYKIKSDYDTCAPFALRFRSNIEEATTGNTARQGSGYDSNFGFALIHTASTGESFYVYDDLGNQDTKALTTAYFDKWVIFEITRDGTNAKLYADDVLIETGSFDPDAVSTNPATSIMVTDSEDDLYSDWVFVRPFVSDEPFIESSEEEEDLWSFSGGIITMQETVDNLLVLLGLVMIPASTIFLVHGGKDSLSDDKVFYFLVALFLGFGFLVGGIMP